MAYEYENEYKNEYKYETEYENECEYEYENEKGKHGICIWNIYAISSCFEYYIGKIKWNEWNEMGVTTKPLTVLKPLTTNNTNITNY